MDDSTRQRIEWLEREVAALRARERRRRPRLARSWLLGGLLILLLVLSPLGTLAANFVDLNPGSGHNANINAIADAGISRGCVADGSRYCPNETVTREQMASFLARTAGLGGNPPVVNALTAVTAQTATNATNATNAVTAQTAIDAPNAQPKYARIVVVSAVGTAAENGTALRNAVAGITGASAATPFLIFLEPGTYDLGNSGGALALLAFVEVAGAGAGITTITHGTDAPVVLPGNMTLRDLAVACTGTNCHAANVAATAGQTTQLARVALSGNSVITGGLRIEGGGTVLVTESAITVTSAGAATGINVVGTTASTLIVRRSTISSAVSPNTGALGISLSGSGAHSALVEHSVITSTNQVGSVATGQTIRLAASQLSGNSIAGAGTKTCAGVYDEAFAFSVGPACP